MNASRSAKARGAGLVLLLTLALWSPVQALAGAELPFRGSDVGTFTITPGGVCAPGWFQVDITGGGTATHVGRYTYTAVECFDGSSAYAGDFTLVAADGDTLFGSYEGEVVAIVGSLGFYEQDAEIEGGTGRFADAEGSFEVSGIANLDPAELSYTQDLAGALGRLGVRP